MFIGHFALGFAAKKAAPRTPLPTLFAAAVFADILWPVFLALGAEEVVIDPGNTVSTPLHFVSYPYSHTLVMLVMWGAVFGGLYLALTKDSRGAVVLAALAAYLRDAAMGAPPPSVRVIWISALVATAVTLLLAWWVDRHRDPTVVAGSR